MHALTHRSRRVTLSIAFAWLNASSPALAALDVAWDCYLPSAQVSCRDVEGAFFSQGFYTRSSPVSAPDVADAAAPAAGAGAAAADGAAASGADAVVVVRAVPVADGASYTIEVKGRDGTSFSYVDRVPGGFTSDAIVLRLVGDLQKATAHLLVVDEPASLDDGVLTLKLRDPDEGPRAARKDDETTGWYVAPQLNVNLERFGVGYVNANGFVDVNWSHRDWRLKSGTWASYRLVVADPQPGVPAEDLRYENFNVGTDWTVVRGFANGFSPAANAYVMREPTQNYDVRAGMWVGLEWVLVPFLKNDEGNFGFQYVIGPEVHDYRHTTVQNRDELYYMRHRARAAGIWHFSRVDLEGTVTAVSHLTDIRFSSISSYAGITWRILDDLSLSFNGEISYRNALLNEPRDLSKLHPLEQFYGGGAYGDYTAWSWIGLQYTFGNSLLLRQDQRWRG